MNSIYLKTKSLKAVILTCFALIATSCGSSNGNPFPGPGGPGGGYGGGACTGPGGVIPPNGLNVGFSAAQVSPPQSGWSGGWSSWNLNISSLATGGALFQNAWAMAHDLAGSRLYLQVTGLPVSGGPIGPLGVNGTISLSSGYVTAVKAASYYNLQFQNNNGYQAQPLCVQNVQVVALLTPSFSGGHFMYATAYFQWNYNGFHSSMNLTNFQQ